MLSTSHEVHVSDEGLRLFEVKRRVGDCRTSQQYTQVVGFLVAGLSATPWQNLLECTAQRGTEKCLSASQLLSSVKIHQVSVNGTRGGAAPQVTG